MRERVYEGTKSTKYTYFNSTYASLYKIWRQKFGWPPPLFLFSDSAQKFCSTFTNEPKFVCNEFRPWDLRNHAMYAHLERAFHIEITQRLFVKLATTRQFPVTCVIYRGKGVISTYILVICK